MPKYIGPCIDCGEYKNQNYIRQRCPACNEKFRRHNPDFIARKKYDGPCVNCGSFESTNGRFVRKLCERCYGRFKANGSPEYRKKYSGPCVVCGSLTPDYAKYFQEKMCGKCYRKHIHAVKHPKQQGYCIDCGIAIETKRHITRKKRCNSCYTKWKRASSPAYVKKEKDRQNRYYSTEKGRESRRSTVRKRRAILANVEATLTKEEWQEILKHFDYKCAYCKSAKKIEMDHVFPISKGGTHTANNVVPACRKCNSSKGNKVLGHHSIKL